jgi:CO/xanthine dehydrogenase Mo-binding subunit
VTRYTAFQDVGRAIHPDYCEGQIQGGVAQGIGWALSEEYIYNKDGKLDNAGLPRLSHARHVGPAQARRRHDRDPEPQASAGRSRRRRRCRWCR